jgi:hypothetical protein
MSTTWMKAENEEEWVVTTFFGGVKRGRCMDFGARTVRAFDVMEAAEARGEMPFAQSEEGEVVSGNEFREMAWGCGEWTHGEFGGTMTPAQAVEWEVG